jgi:hypothetical protein
MSAQSFLYNAQGSKFIPLKDQKIFFEAQDQNALYTITQKYENSEELPIETYFSFPVPAEASVFHFEAILEDGTVIECKIKEQEEAKQEYNKAIINGDTAYYMQRHASDQFSIMIGNLAPKQTIHICFKFAIELKNDENQLNLRIVFPLTIMPKFVPAYQYGTYGNQIHYNPEKIDCMPYDLSIKGLIHQSLGIKSLDSKTHKIKISDMKSNSLSFEIDSLDALNQDIVLTVEREAFKSYALVEKIQGPLISEMYRYCICANICPDFSSLPALNIIDIHYVILLDTSGSMQGPDIEICKLAAQQFVGLLPTNCTFDVYEFNSKFTKFTPDIPYSKGETNQKKIEATDWIEGLKADGGTDIYPVLIDIYAEIKKIKKQGILIVLSDGGVYDTDRVLNLVKSNHHVNLFTIGIGQNVSRHLIQGMATQGNGYAEFIGSGDKNITQKVRSQLKRSQDTLRRSQNHYKLEINGIGGKTRMIPQMPALLEKTNNLIYMFSEFEPISVTYSETINDDEKLIQTLVSDPINYMNCFLIHRIAALKLIESMHSNYICQWDDRYSSNKAEIIQISTDMNVLSSFTAFIGIQTRKDKVTGELQQRIIPLQEPKSIGHKGYECKEEEEEGVVGAAGGLFGDDEWDCEDCEEDEDNSFENASLAIPPISDKSSLPISDKSLLPIESAEYIESSGQIEYEVLINLSDTYISMKGGVLSCKDNKSLINQLLELVPDADHKIKNLVINQYIKLVAESNSMLNGVYQILSIGSDSVPWVLQRI